MKIQILLSGLVVAFATPRLQAAENASSGVAPATKKISAPRLKRVVCAPVSEGPNDGLDVVLEQLNTDGQTEKKVGEQILNDDARQTIATVVSPDQTQNYLVHIKNTGQNTTTFRVSFRGLLSATGTETAWAPQGWSARATLDGKTTDIIAPLKSEQGWETPRLNLGEETVLRLSLTAPAKTAPLTDGSFRVRAHNGEQNDVVIGRVGPQFIAKLQWALDGDKDDENRWHDVTAKTFLQVSRFDTFEVRAIKAVPAAPWVEPDLLGPKWTFQGRYYEGDDVWIGPENPALSGAPVTATMGNSLSFQVRVLPDAFVELDANGGYAVLLPNSTQTQPKHLSIKVTGEDDNPLPQTKVRIRVFKGKTAIASSWTPDGKDKATLGTDEFLMTNDQGEIEVDWMAKAGDVSVGDKIEFKAEAVDEGNKPFGSEDTYNVSITSEEIG